MRRERERYRSSESVSDDGSSPEIESGIEIGDDLGECIHVVGEAARRRLLTLAEAWKIRSDELEVG